MLSAKLSKLAGKSGRTNITYSDQGLRKIERELDALATLVLSVGVIGGEKYPGGLSVAFVGAMLEFGAEDRPARPFMRRTLQANASKIAAYQAQQYGRVAMGEISAVDAVSNVGKLIAGLMVESIDRASGWAAPDDETTVEAKGGGPPLKDSGKLRDSISWSVRQGSPTGSVLRRGKP
jgi:hypothetical protein